MKQDLNRKRIIVCLENANYNYLKTLNVPNIKSLGMHPACAFGGTTRASVAAMLGGFMPICQIEGCWHKEAFKRWPYVWYLTDYFKANKLFLYIPNGWILELIEPFIRPDLKPKIQKWLAYHDSRDMINDFLSRKLKGGYFAYFHIMETHSPYYPDKRGIEDNAERRKAAFEYVDRIIKPLIDLDVDDLVVTADHGTGSFLTRKPFEVFIAARIKGRG